MSERLRKAAQECADDLETELKEKYVRIDGVPMMLPDEKRRFDRDMAVVRELREALAEDSDIRSCPNCGAEVEPGP